MPSGITHMLLSMKARDSFPPSLRDVIDANLGAFLAGSVAPDLPYASFVGNPINAGMSEIADLFHYRSTNEIPLRALANLPKGTQSGAAFAFFAGYASHVVGDGVGHPFVRDKVGDYAQHKAEHRTLEMELDVLFCRSVCGVNLRDAGMADYLEVWGDPGRSAVLTLFAELIGSVYGQTVTADQIGSWINGLKNLLDTAAEIPCWYEPVAEAGLTYFNSDNLERRKEQILTLQMPVDAQSHKLPSNFAGRPSIHFFKDCVPQYTKCIIPIIEKAYTAVFNGGRSLTEKDLPAINLDTGRLIVQNDGNDLSQKPFFWNGAT